MVPGAHVLHTIESTSDMHINQVSWSLSRHLSFENGQKPKSNPILPDILPLLNSKRNMMPCSMGWFTIFLFYENQLLLVLLIMFLCNMVIFLWNTWGKNSIIHLWKWSMECFMWVPIMVFVLLLSVMWYMEYCIILDIALIGPWLYLVKPGLSWWAQEACIVKAQVWFHGQ